MKKEDILERSRNEKKDEGVEYTMSKGRKIGVAGMASMFIILFLFNFFTGQDNYMVEALFWSYIGFESFGRYSVTKQKVLLFTAIVGVIVGILALATHIISVLR